MSWTIYGIAYPYLYKFYQMGFSSIWKMLERLIIGLNSYARNSQKKQYLIFGEILFSFAYLSAVWLLFGQNPIKIIVDTIFVLDFAKIVTKLLINKQN